MKLELQPKRDRLLSRMAFRAPSITHRGLHNPNKVDGISDCSLQFSQLDICVADKNLLCGEHNFNRVTVSLNIEMIVVVEVLQQVD